MSKIGSHPVLPQAAQVIAQNELQHEYGMGIHLTPSYGMTQCRSDRTFLEVSVAG